MATLDTLTKNTLLDLATETGPDGELMRMAMILAETNEILLDAPWFQANAATYHQILQSLSLPTGNWRMINRGVALEAAHGVKVNEELGMLESFCRTDKKLVDIAPDPMGFRNNKGIQTIEGMNQTFAEALIYGNNVAAPEEITGLAPRLNDTDLTLVTSAGSTATSGDLTSVYIVQWGEGKVYLVYPRDAETLGVSHQDNGELTLDDPIDSTKKYRGYEDHYRLDVGLVVEDPRCIARICDIETTGATNILTVALLTAALNKMPQRGNGSVIYANPTIFNQLDVLSYAKTSPITYGGDGDVFGRPVTRFRGLPVRLVDQILDTEELVTS